MKQLIIFLLCMAGLALVNPENRPTAKPEKEVALSFFPLVKKYYILELETTNEEDNEVKAYVKRFYKTALEEQRQFGIPASVTLAQGLHESDKGKSRLAKDANNHFGIKCFSKSCGKGHCINYSDDSHKDFFRKYESAWYSYRAHSKLIAGVYKKCLNKNYIDCSSCIAKKGYATDKKYKEKLIAKIEKYKLQQFDK